MSPTAKPPIPRIDNWYDLEFCTLKIDLEISTKLNDLASNALSAAAM